MTDTTLAYSIGDCVLFRTFMGNAYVVKVTGRFEIANPSYVSNHLAGPRPGFDGINRLDPEMTMWGYDDQIISVYPVDVDDASPDSDSTNQSTPTQERPT